ncbi:MAG: hypothetical protein Q7S00_01820 [bacterium]|nr:hypothetical protein [bacterium]
MPSLDLPPAAPTAEELREDHEVLESIRGGGGSTDDPGFKNRWIQNLRLDPNKPTIVLVDYNEVLDSPRRAANLFTLLQINPNVDGFYLFGTFPDLFLNPDVWEPLDAERGGAIREVSRFHEFQGTVYPKLKGDLAAAKFFPDPREVEEALLTTGVDPERVNVVILDDYAPYWRKEFSDPGFSDRLRNRVHVVGLQTPGVPKDRIDSSIFDDWDELSRYLSLLYEGQEPFPSTATAETAPPLFVDRAEEIPEATLEQEHLLQALNQAGLELESPNQSFRLSPYDLPTAETVFTNLSGEMREDESSEERFRIARACFYALFLAEAGLPANASLFPPDLPAIEFRRLNGPTLHYRITDRGIVINQSYFETLPLADLLPFLRKLLQALETHGTVIQRIRMTLQVRGLLRENPEMLPSFVKAIGQSENHGTRHILKGILIHERQQTLHILFTLRESLGESVPERSLRNFIIETISEMPEDLRLIFLPRLINTPSPSLMRLAERLQAGKPLDYAGQSILKFLQKTAEESPESPNGLAARRSLESLEKELTTYQLEQIGLRKETTTFADMLAELREQGGRTLVVSDTSSFSLSRPLQEAGLEVEAVGMDFFHQGLQETSRGLGIRWHPQSATEFQGEETFDRLIVPDPSFGLLPEELVPLFPLTDIVLENDVRRTSLVGVAVSQLHSGGELILETRNEDEANILAMGLESSGFFEEIQYIHRSTRILPTDNAPTPTVLVTARRNNLPFQGTTADFVGIERCRQARRLYEIFQREIFRTDPIEVLGPNPFIEDDPDDGEDKGGGGGSPPPLPFSVGPLGPDFDPSVASGLIESSPTQGIFPLLDPFPPMEIQTGGVRLFPVEGIERPSFEPVRGFLP